MSSFASVGVVGLGVMGGSLARALRGLASPPNVVGWSTDPDDLERALRAGAVTRLATGLEDCVSDVELVVLATPVDATCRLIPEVGRLTGPGTVIHDVASLKQPVREAVVAASLAGRWVGGHPMSGSEQSGFLASRGDLYEESRVWLVADPEAADALHRTEGLWRAVGARPSVIDADAHDRLMALASHLPQLTANVLARVLSQAGITPSQMGPGGRDTTRLAESRTAMWLEIFAHAPEALTEALRALSREAAHTADALEAGDLTAIGHLMDETRAWKEGE